MAVRLDPEPRPCGRPSARIVDGNEAVAAVAYRLNEVIAIYPITPSRWRVGRPR
jgi:hypothetical protein